MKKYIVVFSALLISLSVKSQDVSKKVTLLWDSSFSMIDRNLENDLEYLATYFNNNPTVSLNLQAFSNEIILHQDYTITNGNWKELEEALRETIYDGTTNYEKIKLTPSDEVLLFSDGYSYIDTFPTISSKITVISSGQKINKDFLKRIAKKSKGRFIALEEVYKNTKSIPEFVIVSGIVVDENGPLSDVTILSRENNTQSVTDQSGNYSITAKSNGLLEFRYLGKNTILARVLGSTNKNIVMTNGNEILEELVIENTKKELVNNGYSTSDKKRLGYSVKSIPGSKISSINTNAKGAIVGKFAGVEVASNDDLSQFLGRGKNTTIKGNQYGLIVLDGVPLKQSNSYTGEVLNTNFINPENIESITYLKGLAATNIYGSQGSNGVLLIKSKTGSSSFRKKDKKQLGNTPFYDEDATLKKINNKSYLKEITKTTSIDDAYRVYLQQRKFYGNEISFFFDMASYFNQWNAPYLVKRVMSNVLEISNSSEIELLRALAYKYEEFGLYEDAIALYKNIIQKQPKDTQTYRNLALTYKNNKEYGKAQEIYNKIISNQYSEINTFSGIRKTINSEYKNLVALYESSLQGDKIPPFYKNKSEYHRRIVFEWSQFDAAFDLQIVNPQKRYFTWSHTEQSEPSRFKKETQQGYGLEEFFITSKDQGEWIFNISYFGKKTGNNSAPTYLKITVYENYGQPTQSKKIINVELQEFNKKETVLKINI